MQEMVFRIFGLELLIHARMTEFRVRDRIYLDFGMFICKFWVVTRESSCFARQADIWMTLERSVSSAGVNMLYMMSQSSRKKPKDFLGF